MTQIATIIVPPKKPTDTTVNLISTAYVLRAATRGPKYLCLHAALSGMIERGALPPGAQLPSDDQIAGRLGVSVGTVQKAMHALREDGILERRQGAGTFVIDPSIDMHDVWHFRFLDDDGVSFLPLKARAIKLRTLSKRGPWSQYMTGAKSFIVITRLIDVNAEFNLLSDFYIDGDRFADLAEEPLKIFHRVVLRNLLAERYGIRANSARQHLGCQTLTARDCRIAKIKNGSIGMVLETFGTDNKNSPIYYQRVVIPQNNRRLVVEQKP